MRTKDKNIMQDIIDETNAFFVREGRAPSTRELSERVALSHNRIAVYLKDMADSGMIGYENGKIVTDKISKIKTEYISVPILGSISCGIPLLSEENVESYVKLPTELVGRGDYYFLRANGDSMTNAGIEDGDFVLINKTTEANNGDIVVALIDNENTLKRLYRDDKNRKIILHPENEKYEDISVDHCQVQGVAVKVLKDIK